MKLSSCQPLFNGKITGLLIERFDLLQNRLRLKVQNEGKINYEMFTLTLMHPKKLCYSSSVLLILWGRNSHHL